MVRAKFAAFLIFLAVSSLSASTRTIDYCPADWSAFDCHFITLEVASLDASQPKHEWADWYRVTVPLDAALLGVHYTLRERSDDYAGALSALRKYDERVAQFVQSGDISRCDAWTLRRMSAKVRRDLEGRK